MRRLLFILATSCAVTPVFAQNTTSSPAPLLGTSQTNPEYVNAGASTFTTAQAAVSTTSGSTAACAAGAPGRSVMVQQLGTTAAYLGNSGVSSTTGVLLPGTTGSAITISTSAAVYAVTASGTTTVACMRTY